MKIMPFLLAGSAFAMTSAVAAQTAPMQPTPSEDTATEAPAAEAPTATPPAATTTDSTTTTSTTTTTTGDDMAAAGTDTATPMTFTDEQIQSFAAAALKIQALDPAQPATQEQLMAIVTESGLDPQTYVAINDAMSKDAEVAKRVQVAAGEIAKNPAG